MSVEVLDGHVLVLNRFWQAIDVCSVRKAICLLYLKHAQVVTKNGGSFYTFGFEDWKDFSRNVADDGNMIRTISYNLKIPQIILLFIYDKLPPWEVKFTRRNIYKRDKNICQYCGKKFQPEDLNLDHVVPLSRGGKDSWENVVCSCVACNLRKGNKILKEVRMNLIRLPRKPRWRTFVKDNFAGVREESWKDFLDIAYWNVELEQDEE